MCVYNGADQSDGLNMLDGDYKSITLKLTVQLEYFTSLVHPKLYTYML